MYFCGPWAAGSFDAAEVNYGIAGVPAGPAGKATLAQGVGMYMTSSHLKRKKKQFMISLHIGRVLMHRLNGLAVLDILSQIQMLQRMKDLQIMRL